MISFSDDNELKFIIGLRVANSAFSNLYQKENKIFVFAENPPTQIIEIANFTN